MIIDADGHFLPWIHSVESNAHHWLSEYREFNADRFSCADLRQQELRDLGIDKQLLNPFLSYMVLDYSLDPAIVPQVMQSYNDSVYDIVDRADCFEMNIWMGIQNVPACVDEIYRNLDRDFFGLFVSDQPCYGFIKRMEPIWRLANQYRIPFYMHLSGQDKFIMGPDDEYQSQYQMFRHKLDLSTPDNPKPRTWLTSVASILYSDVLDRYPDLKIVWAERDLHWIHDLRRVFDDCGLKDPLPLLQKHFWFTTEPESEDFLQNAQLLGWDRLLFATDWPHVWDAGGRNSMHDIDTVLGLPMTEAQRTLLFNQNFQGLKR